MLDENSGCDSFCWTLLLRVMVAYEDFIDQLHMWVFIGKSARGVSPSRCVAQGLDWCSTLPDMAFGSPVPKENVQAKEAKLGAGGYESTRAPASSAASIMDLDDAGSDGGSHSELETETSNNRAKSRPQHLRSDSGKAKNTRKEITSWWFIFFGMFTPDLGEMIQFDKNIFQWVPTTN